MMAEIITTLHGTTANSLTPRAIVQTAESDMARKARNTERAAERVREKLRYGNLTESARNLIGRDEPYAFSKKHVKKATTSKELIEIAIANAATVRAEIEFWEHENAKIENDDDRTICPYAATTIMLYQNDERLIAAMALCENGQ